MGRVHHLGFQLPLCCLPFSSYVPPLPVACRQLSPVMAPRLSLACQVPFPGVLILSKVAFAEPNPGTFNIHLENSPTPFVIERWCLMCFISRTGNGCLLGREMAQPYLWQSVPWSDTTWLQPWLQHSARGCCNCQWPSSIEQTALAHHCANDKVMKRSLIPQVTTAHHPVQKFVMLQHKTA